MLSGIIWYLSFVIGLFIYHNVLRAHLYCRISFLLNTEWYSIVCTCNILFIRSSVREHLGCFSALWIMMLWTGVFNDLFKVELSVRLGLPSEVGCWSRGISDFSFLRNCHFPTAGVPLYIPTRGAQGLQLLRGQGWWLSVFLRVTILMGRRWNLTLVLCTSLIPGLGRSQGEGNDKPLQYSCLGESHGQGSLQAMGSRESDTTERLNLT